jgi:hypothetical protein
VAKTPLRSIRVPTDVWRAAQAKAEERGETLTEAIIRFLRRYAAKPTPPAKSKPAARDVETGQR